MKKAAVSKTVFRENYKPFAWNLDQVKLRFEIGDELHPRDFKIAIEPESICGTR